MVEIIECTYAFIVTVFWSVKYHSEIFRVIFIRKLHIVLRHKQLTHVLLSTHVHACALRLTVPRIRNYQLLPSGKCQVPVSERHRCLLLKSCLRLSTWVFLIARTARPRLVVQEREAPAQGLRLVWLSRRIGQAARGGRLLLGCSSHFKITECTIERSIKLYSKSFFKGVF